MSGIFNQIFLSTKSIILSNYIIELILRKQNYFKQMNLMNMDNKKAM